MQSSKPSGQATTVVNNDPWEGQQDYLKRGFADAEVLKNNPVQYYPNSTVVPFHGATTDALGGIEQRARAGSNLLRAGQDQVGLTASGGYAGADPASSGFAAYGAGTGAGQDEMAKTASGYYLGSNPHLDAVVKQATDAAGAMTDARFSKAGRYGSGHHKFNLEDMGGRIASSIYAPAYEAERARMGGAAGALASTGLSGLAGSSSAHDAERERMLKAAGGTAPLAAADYYDLEKLGGVGAAHEGHAANTLQDQINRYMHAQQAPRDALKEYMASIGGGSYGGTQTAQQPLYSNPWATGLGAVGQAASIAGTLWGQDGIWPQG